MLLIHKNYVSGQSEVLEKGGVGSLTIHGLYGTYAIIMGMVVGPSTMDRVYNSIESV